LISGILFPSEEKRKLTKMKQEKKRQVRFEKALEGRNIFTLLYKTSNHLLGARSGHLIGHAALNLPPALYMPSPELSI
jgi:hypothetical protein